MSPEPRELPARPVLRRLRDEAKSRKRSGEFATLAEAQYTVAREYGFASWPRLKIFVQTRSADVSTRAAALVRSACSSNLRIARTLLEAGPDLARHGLAAACVTGEAAEVARLLERDPEAVRRKLAPLDWEPLLYACFSRFLRADPVRTRGIVQVVRLLLDAGADPNVYWLHDEFRQLPVYGAAGIANNPELTRMLLDAGADPNETYEDPETVGEALYHAVEFSDPACARMLIEAGSSRTEVSHCLGRALNFPNPAMVEMMLACGAVPHGHHVLQAVYNRRPLSTVAALLDAGAPVDEVDEHGMTPLRVAVAWGRDDLAGLLTDRGADPARVTAADRSLELDERVLNDLLEWAVMEGDAASVRRLLAAGAPIDGLPDAQFPPLAQAAWRGRAEVARLLVDHGAALRWGDGGSAMGATLHGSVHCHHPEGGPSMKTVDEVTHGDYGELIRFFAELGQPIPQYLEGVRELDVPMILDRLGVEVPHQP
jgi:ankyrin repeat protein